MKVFKEGSCLVFGFEDGATVKYDFATKKAIGKSGKPVNSLCSQLRGFSIDEVISSCENEQYGDFLKFVADRCYSRSIINLGTIIAYIPKFLKYEQFFSSGIGKCIVNNPNLNYAFNDVPKSLVKICKTRCITLNNSFVRFYKQNPNGYLTACSLEYDSLSDKDIELILSSYIRIDGKDVSEFTLLTEEYGYNAKSLMQYLDYLKSYEALENIHYIFKEVFDYAKMMKMISPKFEKYPRHFLTTHRISCRNYNRLKKHFEEENFKKRINLDMEYTFGKYTFIYPKSTQEIKDEAVAQGNCVASYIQDVIDGRKHILFLRLKSEPEKSLVTIEVRDNKIVQARRKFNYSITSEQQEAVDAWNDWYSKKCSKEVVVKKIAC